MPSPPLDGLGVLVTRPRSRNAGIVAAIESRGGSAVVFPSLEIAMRDPGEIERDVEDLSPADITIFISRNAVEQGIRYASGAIAAIGPATAAAIETAGRRVDIRSRSGSDSEHLLAESAFDEVQGKTIRIIRGGAGRNLLADTLRQRGAAVEYLSTYERRRPEYSAADIGDLESRWRAGQIGAVIVMSVESLVNLLSLLPEWCLRELPKTPLVTPSARVLKEALKRIPGCRAVLAAGTQTDALCDGLAAATGLQRTTSSRIKRMSDKDKDEQPSSDDVGDEKVEAAGPAAEAIDEEVAGEEREAAEEQPAAPAPAADIVIEKKRGASATVAWLALFLALITVAGVGYLYLEKYREQASAAEDANALAALSEQLAATNRSLDDLSASVGDLDSAGNDSRSALESLRRDLDSRGQLFDSLPPRMSKLERSVAALQGVSLEARNTYLVAEAEYYLQIANAQLQLAGNAYLASLALKQADDRLLQLGDPALTDVRRAVAEEIATLEVMQQPDIAGLSLTLASLARVVESLPLRRPAGAAADSPAEEAEPESGAGRAWNAVKGAVSGLVKHTPPGDDAAPLLTPDAEPLIRSNLSLKLQAARLAMLRGEPDVFRQSLEDADSWLVTYFDVDSEPVSGARATLTEVGAEYSVSAAPDISTSLRLLRQYKALVERDE